MTKIILALTARIFHLVFFDSVLLSSHKYIYLFHCEFLQILRGVALCFCSSFFFNYKVKGENGLNHHHNNSNYYIDGDRLGTLHLYGRVIELNHMCGWLPGWAIAHLICKGKWDLMRQISYWARRPRVQQMQRPWGAKESLSRKNMGHWTKAVGEEGGWEDRPRLSCILKWVYA